MRTQALVVGLPSLIVLACGGAVAPIDPTTFQLEGSYDLAVDTVDLTGTQQQPSPPNSTHPAMGGHARLDIKKINGAYQAAITVDFSDPLAATVSATSDGTVTVEVQYGASFTGGSNGYQYVSDQLTAFRFKVGSDNKLSGAWSATGNEMVSEGDVGWQNNIASTGSIGADARPPRVTANVGSPSLSTGPLPWDPIYIRVSEPVAGPALQNNATLGGSGALSVAWFLQPNSPDWVGATQLVGYRSEWATQGSATLGVAAGIADPTGNVTASVATPIGYVDVPLAAAFDGTATPAQWGPVVVQSGAMSCGSDGVSCLEIGPLTGPCSGPLQGGIAGRLTPNGNGNLTLKYRVRAASQYGQPFIPSGLGLSIATPGQPAQGAHNPLSPQLSPINNDPNYAYASDWVVVTEPLPANASEVGFAFAPFDEQASSYCSGGWAPPPVTLLIDVVQVTTSP